MGYQVSNFIIGIKNAAAARRKTAVLPYSKMNKNIGAILVKEGFLENIKEETTGSKKALVATLKYDRRIPVLSGVKIISKPSLRVYVPAKNIFKIASGRDSKVILSTNKGIMTANKARKEKLGGEVLFSIS